MASAQISETIRPAYIWTGEEWIQIGDGGSGSVVGGTNIDVQYNEALNTFTVSTNSDLENYINTASAAAAAYTDQEISDLVAGAPEALDTLNELAAALNDDDNFASTVVNSITSASAFALSESSGYTDETIDQLFIHEDHINIQVSYDEESNRIIVTGEEGGGGGSISTTSYGTAYPNSAGEEEEIFYQLNEEKTKVVNRYVYLDGDWRLFSEESFNWENLGLQTWQWLLDTSEVGGWEYLTSGQTIIGNVDFNARFVPNIIADIRYLQKNEFGEALVSGSTVVLNYLSSGSPTLNGGIKVNRGNENPVELIWNEEKNYWEFTEDGENYKKLGSGAVLYQSSQPDVSDLEVGTLWIDEDQPVGSGLDIQTFLSWTKTLSASASVFSGTDDNFAVLKYRINLEQVYLNGTLLVRDVDYTASNGTSITLTEAAVENDVITIHAFESFLVSETYNKNQIDSTFLTQGSASATYLTQESASNIYLTEISASVSYVPRNETELVKYGPTEPASPEEGTIWIDSTNVIKPITKVYNGSTWIIASGASEAAIHPFFLAGI